MRINFPKDFSEFVKLLEKHNAEYLVVGGYAVGYWGHVRFTGDLDIWLKPSKETASKILSAVNEFGFASLKLKEDDLSTVGNVIQLGYPPLRINLLNDIDGVSFDESYPNKVVALYDGFTYNFISYDDLIKNKKATGRNKDLADVDELEK
jgi:hypothetical protein